MKLLVPLSMSEDFIFDFNLCVFDLEAEFFEELRQLSELVKDNGLHQVAKFVDPPGFYCDDWDGSEPACVEFCKDRVMLNVTDWSVYWSATVSTTYREIVWKSHSVPLNDLFRRLRVANQGAVQLDYR